MKDGWFLIKLRGEGRVWEIFSMGNDIVSGIERMVGV